MATRKEINRLPAVLRLATVAEALQNTTSPVELTKYLPSSDLSSESEDNEAVQSTPRRKSKKSHNRSRTPSAAARPATKSRAVSTSRAKAPPRAVFNDLTTAHSFITSGDAGRSRSPSRTSSAPHDVQHHEQEDSLHLQDLRQMRSNVCRELPVPPKSVAIPRGRRRTPNNFDYLEDDEAQQQQEEIKRAQTPALTYLPQGQSMFSNIKSAIGTFSSPLKGKPGTITGDRSSDAAKNKEASSVYYTSSREEYDARPVTEDYENANGMLHPGYNGRKHGSYKEIMEFQDFPSTPAEKNPSRAIVDPSKLEGFGCERSSAPEGSTIGNIYKHYIGSQRGDSEQSEPQMATSSYHAQNYFHRQHSNAYSSSSPYYDESSDLLQPSALTIRKQRRAERAMESDVGSGEPPTVALPKIPSFEDKDGIPSSPPVIHSHRVPRQQQLDRHGAGHGARLRYSIAGLEGRADLAANEGDAQSEWETSSMSRERHLSSNNPYKMQINPRVIVSHHHHEDDVDFTVSHEPLEREVSKALRRASGYTTYSNGSLSTTPLRYEDYQSEISTSGLLRKDEPLMISSGDMSDGMSNQFQTFYNKGALPDQWMRGSRQHGIRIPINQTGHFPASPPMTPFVWGSRNVKGNEEDPDHEWETCDERTADSMSIKLGKRTGSSIADTSDYAESQFDGELTHYDSMERILQHPGSEEYGRAIHYRQRDLKDSNQPVLLPVFGEHKVNGQISNSSRFKPVPYRFTPRTPMIKPNHRHPFRTPPEVMTSPMSSTQARHNLNPPPMSLDTLATSPSSMERDGSLPHPRSPARGWLSSFGLPGSSPATNHILRPSPPKRNSRDDRNSWAQANIFEPGGVVPGFNENGTLIDMNANLNEENDPRTLSQARARNTLVDGPPGNFYQGIADRNIGARLGSRLSDYASTGRASRVSSHRPRLPDNFAKVSKKMSPKQMRKHFDKVYPTDRLRPLSLLSHDSIATVDQMHPRGFPAWKKSMQRRKEAAGKDQFTKKELGRFDEEALVEIELQVMGHQEGSMSNVPKILPPPEQMRHDKYHASLIVLVMCNLFPPMLLFYATGKLDWIMIWYWRGNIKAMGKKHKRWAARLAAIWTGLILFALIFSLVYWAKVLHPRHQKG